LFEHYEIDTGIARRQTVIPGSYLGSETTEIAVIHIDASDNRLLHMYGFDGTDWAAMLEATLRPSVLFVDVANIGGRDRLISYENGRLNRFDPESGTESTLLAVNSSFRPPRKDEIPHVDITRDVNGDGRDDLVVPDVDGFWVIVQLGDGTFADAVKIGPPTDMSGIYGADGYRYDPWGQSRTYEMDYNQDGRSDLVSWSGNHFEVHQQDASGLFSPKALAFTIGVAFDSDKIYSLTTGDMTGKVLYSLADLNNDGVGDLVVFSLTGRKISKKQSSYDVHFGTPTPDGGTAFAPEIGATFQSKRSIQLGMGRHDFDGDGQLDLMITTIDVEHLKGSLWKNLKGFMGDDIRLNLEFYRMNDGAYADTPNTTRTVALDGAPSHREPGSVSLDILLRGGTHEKRKTQMIWPKAFNTNLLIGDVTGDGRSDLLIEYTFRGLNVFAGIPGAGLFSQQSHEVAVVVPNDREYTWLVDLNKDGKQDILMHHPFTLRDVHGGPIRPPGTEPHWVTTLISR